MSINLGQAIKGKISGRGVIRDKDGKIKGEIIIGGDATLEQIAEYTGKTPEEISAKGTISLENSHGSDSDNRGA